MDMSIQSVLELVEIPLQAIHMNYVMVVFYSEIPQNRFHYKLGLWYQEYMALLKSYI